MTTLTAPTSVTGRQIERAIAELAVNARLIDEFDAVDAIEYGRRTGESPLARLLDTVPSFNPDAIRQVVADAYGIGTIDLNADEDVLVDQGAVERFGEDWLSARRVLPLRSADGPKLAVADPAHPDITRIVRDTYYGTYVPELLLTRGSDLKNRLTHDLSVMTDDEVTSTLNAAGMQVADLGALTTGSDVEQWIASTYEAAVKQGASDIHVELLPTTADPMVNLRMRINGALVSQRVPDTIRGRGQEVRAALLNWTDMDQSKTREGQTGDQSFRAGDRRIDVRVEYTATVDGGGQVVSRLLDSSSVSRGLTDLGFGDDIVQMLRTHANYANGLITLNGPTGSGKTSTVYATLKAAMDPTRKVITVEDPVEYRLEGAQQIEITKRGSDKKVTFGNTLRRIMRSDPDVIMVGEIRDDEAAEMAAEAALTGHLVITTIHTQTALGLYSRLSGLNLPPWKIAESVSLTVSQRLIRLLHDACAGSRRTTDADKRFFARVGLEAPDEIREANPSGCAGCYRTGYDRRAPVAEAVVPSEALRDLVSTGDFSDRKMRTAVREGGEFITFADSAAALLAPGLTSVDELQRQIGALLPRTASHSSTVIDLEEQERVA